MLLDFTDLARVLATDGLDLSVRYVVRDRPNGSDAKLQAAFTRERTSGAPLAARKERFCLSELQAA